MVSLVQVPSICINFLLRTIAVRLSMVSLVSQMYSNPNAGLDSTYGTPFADNEAIELIIHAGGDDICCPMVIHAPTRFGTAFT